MPFTYTPGEGGGWVVGTAEPTIPPFGSFTYTIQPVGGWELDDMTQPATFNGGFASIGPMGPQGEPGDGATITVGTVSTLAAGSPATVVNMGTETAAVFDFGIPQGQQGIQGIQGPQGGPGVVYATEPLAYDAETQTVSISDEPTFTSVTAGSLIANDGTHLLQIFGSYIYFPDDTSQTTAFVPGDYTPTSGLGSAAFASTSDFYPASSNPAGYLTAPYNPFDQTLNTTDFVQFKGSWVVSGSGSFPISSIAGAWSSSAGAGTYTDSQGVFVVDNTTSNIQISATNIQFSDASQQTTAFIPANYTPTSGLGSAAFASTSDFYSSTNPSGYITSSALSGYATQSWVTSQGYITSAALSPYLTSATAASTYQTISGMSSYLTTSAASSTYAAKASSNTFSANQVIEVTDNTNAALRVTQLGTGEAFRVEDSANPDSSPFVIDASGNVGIGTTANASYKLYVSGSVAVQAGGILVTGSSAANVFTVPSGASAVPLTINNAGTGASFRVNDDGSGDTTPFIIDASGNVGVKTASPSTDLEVTGNIKSTTHDITSAPAAGDSSTKVPTTAWVQAEVPSASTSAAGKVQLATIAETQVGTSTSKVATIEDLTWGVAAYGAKNAMSGFGNSTSGTGAVASSNGEYGGYVQAPNVGLTGYAVRLISAGTNNPLSRGVPMAQIRWDKPILIAINGLNVTSIFDALNVFRLTIGKSPTPITTGDLTSRGFGLRFTAGGLLYLDVHNGTSLSSVSTGITITNATGQNTVDYALYSDGNGNVTLYANDVAVATSNAGPTGTGTWYNSALMIEMVSTGATTTGGGRIHHGAISTFFGR